MWNETDFIKAVKESLCYSDILKKLGVRVHSYYYEKIKEEIKRLNLDTSHFKKLPTNFSSIKTEDILQLNGRNIKSHALKKRLIKEGLLRNECYICNLTTWKDKPISLQIDHINGNRFDNRLENLRILCPNCHSQTDTFAGRNIAPQIKLKSQEKLFCKCGNTKSKDSKLCRKCNSSLFKPSLYKITWPSVQELIERLNTCNYVTLGLELGVSDVAIRKHLQTRNIDPKTLEPIKEQGVQGTIL